jgi:cobalt-zinc-cadmium efflux system outer membrane protein
MSVFSQELPAGTEVRISFEQGKQRLLKESLKVLAEYYQVNLAKCELQAARTWGNPLFVWNADMYSHEWNEYFQMGNQTLVQVEYVIAVSGIRIQTIRQANLGIEIAEHAFRDVVRGLVMEYSESYGNLYILNEKSKIYQVILEKYDRLIASYEKRLDLGVISFNDLVRLRSEYISINSEANANQNEISAERRNLNSLLNFPSETVVIPEERGNIQISGLDFAAALDSAHANRPDFQIAQTNITYYEQSLKVARADAVPTINLGYQPRDRGSNYVRPYAGLVFEMGMPLFDRNQAGIQRAKIEIDQSKTQLEIFENELDNEVFSALFQYFNARENLGNYTSEFISDLDSLSESALDNFQKQNISLLQFLDYQQIYVDTRMQYLDVRARYLSTLNNLNFCVGKDLTSNN